MSPSDVVEMSIQFHKNHTNYRRSLIEYDDKQNIEGVISEWPTNFSGASVLDTPEFEGYVIVPLLTRTQLNEESVALDGICIDTYAPSCIKQNAFCYSLRNTDGQILSCFELNKHGNFVQHEGPGGSTPPEEQRKIVDMYIQLIKNGDLTSTKNRAWKVSIDRAPFKSVNGFHQDDENRAHLALNTLLDLNVFPKKIRRFFTEHEDWNPKTPDSTRLEEFVLGS